MAADSQMQTTARQRHRILLVDDDGDARIGLAELLRSRGYVVETARDGFKALPKLSEFEPDLLVTDLMMPGLDGLELIRKARELAPEHEAIVMTAHGSIDTALTAIREGAADYVLKPFGVEELLRVIRPALARQSLRRQVPRVRRGAAPDRLCDLIGASPSMQGVFDTLVQVARSRASVLIAGESGTGKELVAAAIHQLSPRVDRPFVRLHCAALAETLLESELFGHERGAFTGAVARRDGRFQQADGGTIFFDEIGDISPSTQIKLLRFLQEREFERVGGNQTVKVDVRVVAASNTDLRAKVRAGSFREDLLYRLNVVSIEVPPLRDRGEDVPLLAAHFLQKYAAENERELRGFTADALERMMAYGWPGNVRELEHAIERAVVTCRGHEIDVGDLPAQVTGAQLHPKRPEVPGATMAEIERHAILATLEQTGGCTSRAASVLGLSARTIQKRLRAYRVAP
ncbi:MAG TPA: sigma-54 dependent transcriptional regulator [Kofleriaceae bacterium]|nr:sigma-54 dependent transcriptional regulator [Kofleriaceae bacterium]